jgi:hypothetical protein
MTIKEKLAQRLCEATGALFLPEDLRSNPPMEIRYHGVCSWAGWGVKPNPRPGGHPVKVHAYSWYTMRECAQKGIILTHDSRDLLHDYEIFPKETSK